MTLPFSGIYTASKWALEALAETSSYELAPFGVDVAIVEPGAYATEIFGKVTVADDTARVAAYGDVVKYEQALQAGLAASTQGRDPQDVADAIVRLANAPAGGRALRTVVPENPAIEGINAAVAPIQREILKGSGMEALLPKALA
jgi:NAD(P)-dependent dehydrogenase (short-subunit alcohol dehydrogenase family)